MKVLVVGSGGREHALAWKLFASPRAEGIFCAPGNAGTALLGHNLDVQATDVEGVVSVAQARGVDLVVVGPEAPLAAGLVDALAERGIKAFGPTKAAARLEWSKAWAKEFLQRHRIPTAHAEVVESAQQARDAVARVGLPIVLKADGLAGGKGVWVCQDEQTLVTALDALFESAALGEAAARVLVEQYLEGPELSVLAFVDGERIAVMPPARDYKRLEDGDRGPNTGGMGGFTRPAYATPDLMGRLEWEVLRPTVQGMAAEGTPYRGVLYAGLMLTRDGPRVLEFNCRFGDPEAQVILPLLESDLLEICLAVAEGRLDPSSVRWGGGVTCGVVLAASGYPHDPRTGDVIGGLDDLEPGVLAFHGGTQLRTSSRFLGGTTRNVVTNGGRVLTVVATATTLAIARSLAYEGVDGIEFAGGRFRSDIALGEQDSVFAAAPDPWTLPKDAPDLQPAAIATVSQPAAPPTAAVPPVLLYAPSDADSSALAPTLEVLRSLGVECRLERASAHRDAATVEAAVRGAAERGARLMVVAAGGEPALPGLVASWSGLPTIGVPVATSGRAPQDSMLAAAAVPDGTPIAVVSADPAGARVAGWLAASILALADPLAMQRYRAAREAAVRTGGVVPA